MAWKMTPMERITKSGICPASCAFPQFASPLCFLGHPHCWGPFKFFSLSVFHGDFNFQHNQILHVLSRSPVFRCANTSILHKITHSQLTHGHFAHFEISLDPMVPYCYVWFHREPFSIRWILMTYEEVTVRGVLKSSIFVVQRATAPKTGVEFCQGFIDAIRQTQTDRVRSRARCLQ